MVLIYLVKNSYQKKLELEGIRCEEIKLLNGEYKLRVLCGRYNESNIRMKVEKLIRARFVEVKKIKGGKND